MKKDATKKIFLPDWCEKTAKLFISMGHKIVVDRNCDFDILCLIGGPDVSPALYNEEKLPCSRPWPIRDLRNTRWCLHEAKDKPKVGICYGGQFLNVFSGGKMYQDVDGHAGTVHDCRLDWYGNKVIRVNSTHHQMMIPDTSNGVVLGSARLATTLKTKSMTERRASREEWRDTEIVYYWNTRSLCFQPHPEFESAPKECTEAFVNMFNTFMIEYEEAGQGK